MTTTADGTARAAAQLREAARDVAPVAERRTRRAAHRETLGNGTSAPHARQPGSVMRLVAARLTVAGFDVRQEDSDGGSELDIACRDAWCIAWSGESGHDEWEWHPAGAAWADPKQAADLATVLLTGATADLARRGNAYGMPGIAFKGIIAVELAARGLGVRLGVYEDHRIYDVTAEVVAVNPARPQTGSVYVSDSGALTWARDYWDEARVGTPPSGGEPEALAAQTIAGTVISAMIRAGLAPGASAASQTGEPT